MGDNGAGGFNDFWTLDSLSNIANLFLVFVIGSAVPVLTWVFKRNETKRKKARMEEDERIVRTVKAFTDPVENRMHHIEDRMDGLAETNQEVSSLLRELVTKFNDFSDEQKMVNAKVDYIDKVFQDNIKFGTGRRPASGRNS